MQISRFGKGGYATKRIKTKKSQYVAHFDRNGKLVGLLKAGHKPGEHGK